MKHAWSERCYQPMSYHCSCSNHGHGKGFVRGLANWSVMSIFWTTTLPFLTASWKWCHLMLMCLVKGIIDQVYLPVPNNQCCLQKLWINACVCCARVTLEGTPKLKCLVSLVRRVHWGWWGGRCRAWWCLGPSEHQHVHQCSNELLQDHHWNAVDMLNVSWHGYHWLFLVSSS